MEFNEALQKSLKADKHTHSDPFLLHSRVCDLVGNDYEAEKAAEEFYRLDKKYKISKLILAVASKSKQKKRKKHTYKLKPIEPPPDSAYVYFTRNSPTLHLSRECPHLKNKRTLRTSYAEARRIDYRKHTKAQSSDPFQAILLERSHTPPLCRVCGRFSPTYPKTLIEKLQAFLSEALGVGAW